MKNKQLGIAYSIVFIIPFLLLGILPSSADTGHEGATRIERGSYMETAVVTGSSITGTAFINSSVKRPDGAYFNNTASVIWLSTVTATHQTAHEAFRIGFPIASSATFSLDGSMTGTMAFTCNQTVATCEVRRIEGKVQ